MSTILFYTENHARGGGNRYFIDMINVIPLNYKLIIVSNPGGLFAYDFAHINRPYTYISLNIRYSHAVKYRGRFIYLLIKLFFDRMYNKPYFNQLLSDYSPQIVVSANGGYPAALSCLQIVEAAVERSIYSILTVVSMPRAKWSAAYLVEKIYYSSVLKNVDCLVVNSLTIKNTFINTRNVFPDKIFVIYNYTNVVYHIQKREARDNLTIGYIGRVEEAKGVFYLIDAFNRLLKDIHNVRLLLIGDGNDIQKARQKVVEYGIEDYVQMPGFYEGKIDDVLNKMDIFVFPSLWEGFPYSILEAMSAGKIIISTDVGGIPEAIENEISGFLVPPADANKLYETIKKVSLNFKDFENIGIKAQEIVSQKFSQKMFQKNFHSVLKIKENP